MRTALMTNLLLLATSILAYLGGLFYLALIALALLIVPYLLAPLIGRLLMSRFSAWPLDGAPKVDGIEVFTFPGCSAMAIPRGIRRGIVMIGDELADILQHRELEAVIRHEVAHLRLLHPSLKLLSLMILMINIPSGLLLGAWLSRRLEFEADEVAAREMNDPRPLINALIKAHLMGCGGASSIGFTSKLIGRLPWFLRPFPMLEDRVDRLLKMFSWQ